MKLFLGSRTLKNLRDAKNWISKIKPDFFEDLESSLRRQEILLGPCYVFTETSLPEGKYFTGPKNQVDMLICFPDRLILCEIKSYHSVEESQVTIWYNQITAQSSWMEKLLKESSYSIHGISRFILAFNLTANALMSIRSALVGNHSAHHIFMSGAKSALKGESYDANRRVSQKLYFPEALEERLKYPCGIPPNGITLNEFFRKIFSRVNFPGEEPVISFNNFRDARKFLNSQILSNLDVYHDPWYVRGLRKDLVTIAEKLIKEKHIIELVAPPGSGKSTHAKEIFQRLCKQRNPIKLLEIPPLSNCQTIEVVCHKISYVLHGEGEYYGHETLIQQLLQEPVVFWIRDYDHSSLNALGIFFRFVRAAVTRMKPDRVKAYWIIESVQSIPCLTDTRCELSALDNQSIGRIIQGLDSGKAIKDPTEVIRLSQGNPGLAIRLYQSNTQDDIAASKDEFSWFLRQLSNKEIQILTILCLALSHSPLGISERTINELSRKICKGLLNLEINEIVTNLLNKLETNRLVNITRLNCQTGTKLASEILPSNVSMTIVNNVALGLAECVTANVGHLEKEHLLYMFSVVLQDQPGILNHTLAAVTMGLLRGDLEPFFRSSFRSTFLGRILNWLDNSAEELINLDANQEYLVKSLRLLNRIPKEHSLSVEQELEIPKSYELVRKYAYEIVKARATQYRLSQEEIDFSNWVETTNKCQDSDLRAETLVCIAKALLNSGSVLNSWNILYDLLKKKDFSPAIRSLVICESLAFLNRTKAIPETGSKDEDIFELVRQLARELLEINVVTENTAHVGDALFYYVRAIEIRKGATELTSSEVQTYLSMLQFIENIPGLGRRRLQTLLTQGSVIRHFCRTRLDWRVYSMYMDEAFQFYKMALLSAIAQNNYTHILNPISYMQLFCIQALRYVKDDELASMPIFARKCRNVYEDTKEIVEKLDPSSLRKGLELTLYDTVCQNILILRYVIWVTCTEQHSVTSEQIEQGFRQLVNDYIKKIDDRTSKNLPKSLAQLLNALYRAFIFGKKYREERHNVLINLLQPIFPIFFEKTRKFAKLNSQWKNLYSLIYGPDRG
jgi:hypothetical protein